MSILIKNFNENELIPYKEEYYITIMATGGINCIMLFFGILFETLVIASILRVGNKTVDTLFVLSLCCADLIFNLYMLPSNIIVMAAGGWSTGRLGCFVSTGIILETLAISITSITFITLNRYLAIIWRRNITRFQALVMIFATWVILTVVIILYESNIALAYNSIALQPSYCYCLLDFASTDPIVITALITMIIFMSIPLLFIIVAYSQIIHFYIKMNRLRNYVTSEVYKSERTLIIKAMAIASAFFLTYSLELAIRVYQISTKSDVDPALDIFGTMGICTNTLLNSLLLLRFDGLVQSSALELLGLEQWWREKINKSGEKALNRENKKLGIELLKVENKKSKKTEDQSTQGGESLSIETQIMRNDNE